MIRSVVGLLLSSLGLLWVISMAGRPEASWCWLPGGLGVVLAGASIILHSKTEGSR